MKKCPAKLRKTIESFMSDYAAVSKLSEFDIRQTYISFFAKALGWNWDNEGLSPTKLEVYREGAISSGRPDLKFCLNGISKFYMETKKVKPDFSLQDITWNFNVPDTKGSIGRTRKIRSSDQST